MTNRWAYVLRNEEHDWIKDWNAVADYRPHWEEEDYTNVTIATWDASEVSDE